MKSITLFVALLLGVTTFSQNLSNAGSEGISLDGYDVVAFQTENKAIPGSYKFQAEHEGVVYHFKNDKNLKIFQKNPSKFAPQFGGFCTVSTSMGMLEPGNVSTWSVVEGKLYVQRNAKAKGMWDSKGPSMFIGKANENWPKLHKKYGSSLTHHQVNKRMELTLEAAKAIAQAGRAYQKEVRAPGGAIAIVDSGGALIYLVRPDGTFAAAAEVAHEKGRSAAMFRMPSKNLEDGILKGRNSLITVGYNMLRGGLPIYYSGQVVGAIGVSGAASADQDLEIATAAINNAKY